MTAKEYLSQAYRLDQRINSNIEEVTMLREMANSISSPSWGEKVQTSRSTEAPFVRSLEKIIDLEDTINKEIDTLVCLKKQIRTVIEAVQNTDERLVLRYRYIHNCTWEQIGNELNADARTIHNPMTAAFGNSEEMQKAIEMLGSVRVSAASLIVAAAVRRSLITASSSLIFDIFVRSFLDLLFSYRLGDFLCQGC